MPFRNLRQEPETCILYTIVLRIVNVEVVEKYEFGRFWLKRIAKGKD